LDLQRVGPLSRDGRNVTMPPAHRVWFQAEVYSNF